LRSPNNSTQQDAGVATVVNSETVL